MYQWSYDEEIPNKKCTAWANIISHKVIKWCYDKQLNVTETQMLNIRRIRRTVCFVMKTLFVQEIIIVMMQTLLTIFKVPGTPSEY